MKSVLEGVRLAPGFLSISEQEELLKTIRAVVHEAPLYTPSMPRTGKPLSVRMSNCGRLGWVTDKEKGYRYQDSHPLTGKKWPEIPTLLLDIWKRLVNYPTPPEACLINYYDTKARMGLHQDKDEEDFDAPIVSLSLGDDCLFRVGGTKRGGPTNSLRLESGDALVLEGPARMAFHGVDRIYPGTSTLLKSKGRINLTLRRVSKPRM